MIILMALISATPFAYVYKTERNPLFDCALRCAPDYDRLKSQELFILLRFLMQFIIPLVVKLIFYPQMIIIMKKQGNIMKIASERRRIRLEKRKRKRIMIMIYVFLFYTIFW